MCVYMYMHMDLCTPIPVHGSMYTRTCAWTCVHVCMCVHPYMHMDLCTCLLAHGSVYMYACMDVDVNAKGDISQDDVDKKAGDR